MSPHFVTAILIAAVSFLHCGNGARILALFPAASFSHQVVFRRFSLALNERGHDLVVVTPNPVNDPNIKNYTEIDISFLYGIRKLDNDIVSLRPTIQWMDIFYKLEPDFHIGIDKILSLPDLQRLYAPDSNQTFDLILIETLYWPAFLPLAQRFDAPVVGIASLSLTINVQYMTGQPIFCSHPSTWELGAKVTGPLTLWQRMDNFLSIWKFLHHYTTVYVPKQQAIARKYFGDDIPDLHDMEKNISLILVNQQGPISYPKPNMPNIIEIGGFYVSKQIQPLEKELEKFLDEATQGFIYMSLGSNVRSNMLPDEIRREFMAAFEKLPYKVIWKFEDDVLPGKPDNVLIMKWAPQQAILAHPNLKAFIYQGGLQSTEEAIHHAVPLIGIPIWADQEMQVNKLASFGVLKKLEITAIDRGNLLEAIHAVTLDSSYKQKMLNLRSLLQDKPHDPLENAIWWTEYVIRHKGAPHLHSTTADEPWYRRQDVDIIVLITTGLIVVVSLALAVFYTVLVYSIRTLSKSAVGKKRKQK